MHQRLSRPSRIAVGAWLVLSACAGAGDLPQKPEEANGAAELLAAVYDGRPHSVLVQLHSAQAGAADARVAAATAETREAALAHRTEVWRALRDNVRANLPPMVTEGREYSHLPMLHVEVHNAAQVATLSTLEYVAAVFADAQVQVHLAQSLPLMGQPAALAAGLDGSGTTVAVLDTGVDFTRAAFGSCAAPGGACKVVYAQDFAPDDGVADAMGHGTNVAGIVLGVAPAAQIAALDVFTGGTGMSSDIIAAVNWCVAHRSTYNIVAMNLSLGGGGYPSACSGDVFAASLLAARTAGIVPVISSGNNGYLDRIASPACVPAAVSVGAVYDADMGTLTGSCVEASAPDKVACFSNSASFLTLLAPGAMITAAGATYGGTSQAAPHVAGAAAVLMGAYPSETVDQIVARLVNTGASITDARLGRTFPRLDLAAASSGCSAALAPSALALPADGTGAVVTVTAPTGCAWHAQVDVPWAHLSVTTGNAAGTLKLSASANTGVPRSGHLTVGSQTLSFTQAEDTAAPVGTLEITGRPQFVQSASVTLVISASDATGISGMCLSNTTTCTAYVPFASPKAWTLAAGDGPKTVRAWFKDGRGNVTRQSAAATVTLDATLPVDGTLTAAAAEAHTALTWSAASDATSGVVGYQVRFLAGTTLPTRGCANGTLAYSGSATRFVHQPTVNGVTYAYRVCAVDAAGNLSNGLTAVAKPAPETQPPQGTVTIPGSPAWVKSTAVKLALSAKDASTVTSMCLSNTATCAAWIPFATLTAWSLASGNGPKTVSAWFRDAWGNTTPSPVTTAVGLDVTAPLITVLTAAAGGARVDLTWSATSDAHSGFAWFRVLGSTSTTPPASCSAGTVVYQGTGTAFSHRGLINGVTWRYRLCASDVAGNTSLGTTVTATPVP